ncbi:hypothetical protein JOD26_000286 [Limosilactobacillus caviae]
MSKKDNEAQVLETQAVDEELRLLNLDLEN